MLLVFFFNKKSLQVQLTYAAEKLTKWRTISPPPCITKALTVLKMVLKETADMFLLGAK